MKKILIALTILITGCAHYTWVAPGKSEIDTQQDLNQCKELAKSRYPDALIPPPKKIIVGYKCSGSSYNYGSYSGSSYNYGAYTEYNVNCIPIYNYDYSEQIAIEQLRESLIKKCMEEKGYIQERKKLFKK